MAQIIIPASGAVQVRITYSLENIADGTAYGKTRVTITGMEASNATGIAGSGRPAFDVKAVLRSNGAVYSLYSFPGNTAAPLVPLGAGFAAFPGLSAVSVDIPRTARNEQFQFQLHKYAGYGGGGWNPCFVYGSPSKALFLGNQVSATPWGSALIDLPDAASASSTGDVTGTIGTAIYIPINRNNASLTHRLTYAFGGAGGVIGENLATSVSWTPPMELCSQLPASTVGQGTITCETFSAGTKIGETTATLTLYVPESVKPTISPGWAALTYDNAGTAAAAIPDFVQGYSKAKVTFNGGLVTNMYGASTASFRIFYAGADYWSDGTAASTGILNSPGANSLTAIVTDSRGRTAVESISFNVQGYAAPNLSGVQIFRCNSAGTESDGGEYYAAKADVSYSTLNGHNSVTLSVRHKAAGGSYGSAQTMQPAVVKIGGPILVTSTCTVEITATDQLGNTSVASETLPTATVAMNLRKGSDGVAFGKYSEHPKTLELPDGWMIEVGEHGVLHNKNFIANPWLIINQRGQTTYSGEGYTVDRWVATWTGDGTTTVLPGGGIRIARPYYNAHIRQILDTDVVEMIRGKTVTVSMIVDNGNAGFDLTSINADGSVAFSFVGGGTGLVSITAQVPNSVGVQTYIHINNETGHPVDIKAVKLELGSVSTLANDTAPDYTTELLKCMRYFQSIGAGQTIYAGHNGTVYLSGSFRVPMRVTPAYAGAKTGYCNFWGLELGGGNIVSHNVTGWTFSGNNSSPYGVGYLELARNSELGLQAGHVYSCNTDIVFFTADL